MRFNAAPIVAVRELSRRLQRSSSATTPEYENASVLASNMQSSAYTVGISLAPDADIEIVFMPHPKKRVSVTIMICASLS